jgi:hypothetical protein
MQSKDSTSKNSLQPEKNISVPSENVGAVKGVSPVGADMGVTLVSPPPLVVNRSLDTLLLVFHADIPDQLLEDLAAAKGKLQSGLGDEVFFPFGVSRQFSFALQRQGSKFYQYILVSGDVRISFATRKSGSTIPNMQLSVGSISCQTDIQDLVKAFKLWIRHHGIKVLVEKISRLDLCADLAISISESKIHDQSLHIGLPSKFTDFHHLASFHSQYVLTGVQLGVGDIVLRAYDKIKEMSDKKAKPKEIFFQEKWGNKSEITRVEFQLRREVIKEFFPKDSSFKVVFRSISKIWRYLTDKWFRQVSEPVDRASKNHQRYEISFFWQQVQDAFDGEMTILHRNRKQVHINVPALVHQATGIMLTVAAAVGHLASDVSGILETVLTSLSHSITRKMEDCQYARQFDLKWTGAVLSF